MHIGGIHYEIQELRNSINRKADKDEIYQTNSRVDGLERELRTLRSENDGLRSRCEELEMRIQRCEEVAHTPVCFVSDENGFLKVGNQ